jgi:hypothetical protein
LELCRHPRSSVQKERTRTWSHSLAGPETLAGRPRAGGERTRGSLLEAPERGLSGRSPHECGALTGPSGGPSRAHGPPYSGFRSGVAARGSARELDEARSAGARCGADSSCARAGAPLRSPAPDPCRQSFISGTLIDDGEYPSGIPTIYLISATLIATSTSVSRHAASPNACASAEQYAIMAAGQSSSTTLQLVASNCDSHAARSAHEREQLV